jgi:hypothetical protein
MGFEPHETVNAVFGGKAGDGSCFVLPNAARELKGRTDVESPIRFSGEEIDERHRADRNMGPCLRRDPELHPVSPLAASDPLAVDGVLAADELDIGRAA